MKVQVSELSGAALDWAVAKCVGLPIQKNRLGSFSFDAGLFPTFSDLEKGRWQIYRPSVNWMQAGPIIEREQIGLSFYEDGGHPGGGAWLATAYLSEELGPTPLVAAMRCYVAMKLGDEIEIPENEVKDKP